MADDEYRDRMRAASQGITRVLSGRGHQTMADQLASLCSAGSSGSAGSTGSAGDGGYDLDRVPDVYGGGIVAELETRVAELLGKPAAAFFPTGTMAQQVALRIWSEKAANSTVALHPLHHPEMYERKAFSALTGLRSVWPTTESRQPTADEIRNLDEPFSTILIELPLREAGFLLPIFAELTEMCSAAWERGAYVHFDGARLWESTTYLDADLATISALADSVYVSFYKSLEGLGGAVLAGDEAFVNAAKAWRHRHGGQIFTQWPTVLSALIGLDRELPRLPSYVAHARVVAEALATLPGAVVYPNPPHTHQFQLWLPYPEQALKDATLALAEEEKTRFVGGWSARPPGDRCVTEVTIGSAALEWSAEDVVEVGMAFLKRVKAT